MSARVKKAGRIGTKIVAAFLFLFLVMFNVEVGLYDGNSPGSGILGLTMKVIVPNAEAGGTSTPCWGGGEYDDNAWMTYCLTCTVMTNWRGYGDQSTCGLSDPGEN